MHHFQCYLPLSVQSICNFYAMNNEEDPNSTKRKKEWTEMVVSALKVKKRILEK